MLGTQGYFSFVDNKLVLNIEQSSDTMADYAHHCLTRMISDEDKLPNITYPVLSTTMSLYREALT